MTQTMASSVPDVEVSSLDWFCAYMRLHSRGVTPTVAPAEYMPVRSALTEFFGPRSARGFIFKDQGNPAYEVYVRMLFSRVLQLPWPMSGVLPFDFARGLVVEALGIEVNWADFGFRQTHPQQSVKRTPRVLPEYQFLSAPLPPLPFVVPTAGITNKMAMAATIARALDLEGGVTYRFEDAGVEDTVIEQYHPDAEALPAAISHSLEGDFAMKSEVASLGNATPTAVVQTAWHHVSNGRGLRTLEASAISGIVALRASLTDALENERRRLVMARFEIEKPAGVIRRRLAEERDHLRCIDLKIVEKAGTQDRAKDQYQRARDMLNAVKVDNTVAVSTDTILARKSKTKTCEEDVEAGLSNVAIAYAQLESWQLKRERAAERVTALLADLRTAEELQQKKQTIIDNCLTDLQALDRWLTML